MSSDRDTSKKLESGSTNGTRERRWWPWLLLAALLVTLLFAWRFSPLAEFAQPDALAGLVGEWLATPWAPVILGLAYCVANLVLFPNMVVNLAVILALGPLWGIPAALAGSLVAGFFAYWLGAVLGRDKLSKKGGTKLQSAVQMVRDSGLPGMILLRMIPIAPYPIVNAALGASAVSLSTFLLGTGIGIFPSLVAMGAFGLRLDAFWEDPGVTDALLLAAIVLAYLLLVYWLRQTLRSHVRTPGRKLTSDC